MNRDKPYEGEKMMRKLLFTSALGTMLLLGACGAADEAEKSSGSAVEEKPAVEQEVEKEEVKQDENKEPSIAQQIIMKLDEMKEAIEAEDYAKARELSEDPLLGNNREANAMTAYLDYLESEDPVYKKAFKLADTVEYGYSGRLSEEIEEAVYAESDDANFATIDKEMWKEIKTLEEERTKRLGE